MFKDLRILGKESVIYGLSTVLARLLNFLLLPFYTHLLLPGEYGVVSAAYAYIAFLNVLFQHGMEQAYMRFAADRSVDPARTFSTAFWSIAGVSLALAAAIHLAAAPLARWGGLGEGAAGLVRCSAWILALDALSTAPFADLRLDHRAWAYAGVKSFNIALNLALNLLLLGPLHMGVAGVFWASLGASAATLVPLAPVLALRLRPAFDRDLYPALLRFALPLVPAGLGAMAIQVIDRPILLALADEAAVGVYQANYRLGIFMMLIVSMFDQAWRPFYLQRADAPGARELFGRVLTYFLAGSLWLVLALSLFIPDLVRFEIFGRALIHPSYWPGLPIVPVVLAGYVLHGAYINFMASVSLAKRTGILVWVTFLGAAVKIAATLLWVPRWGMAGAAWATFAAYGATATSLFLAGRRIYPIPYETARLAKLAAVSAAVVAACSRSSGAIAERVALLALGPALLLATGFLDETERTALRRRWSRP